MDKNALVQVIAVKADNHIDTIKTVAIASALTLATTDPSEKLEKWLDTDYRKTVRKVSKISQLDKIKELPYATNFRKDSGNVYTFDLMTYGEMPKELRKLQVSGLDYKDKKLPKKSKVNKDFIPVIILNTDIKATTGKMAAQAAHALCKWVLETDPAIVSKWITRPDCELIGISFKGLKPNKRDHILVKDNWVTEIKKGSTTAAIKK